MIGGGWGGYLDWVGAAGLSEDVTFDLSSE